MIRIIEKISRMCEVTLHVIHCPYSHEVLNGHPAPLGDAATAYWKGNGSTEKAKSNTP